MPSAYTIRLAQQAKIAGRDSRMSCRPRCGEQTQGIERHFLHSLVARHCGYPQEPQTAVIPCRGTTVHFPCMQGLHRQFCRTCRGTMIHSSYNDFSSQLEDVCQV